jgi:hypothetical protein
VNGEVKELRLRVAKLEGAAKRLLDVLGFPVDGSKGPEATLEALRVAAGRSESGKGVRECRGVGVEPKEQQTADGAGKRWEF